LVKNDIEFINNDDDYTFMEKKRIENLDIEDYNIRFSLSEENNLNFKDSKVKESIDRLKDNTLPKIYRYKNRYEIYFNKDFRIDMTSVRMSRGNTFKESKVLKSITSYEIEIEVLNKDTDKKYIINSFIEIITLLLSIYYNFYTITPDSEVQQTLQNYKKLINTANNSSYRKMHIIIIM